MMQLVGNEDETGKIFDINNRNLKQSPEDNYFHDRWNFV